MSAVTTLDQRIALARSLWKACVPKAEIVARTGLAAKTVWKHTRDLRARKFHSEPMTAADDARAEQLYARMSLEDVAHIMRRSRETIRTALNRRGVLLRSRGTAGRLELRRDRGEV